MLNDPFNRLSRFLTPLGFTAPELTDLEIFHEQTKFYPFQNRVFGQRIGTYLIDERALQETAANRKVYTERATIPLPPPIVCRTSLVQALKERTSCREFSGESVSLEVFSFIFSGLRVNRNARPTGDSSLTLGFRPYPSGGGLYPCEMYVAALNVEGLDRGIYHYDPFLHQLVKLGSVDVESMLPHVLNDVDKLVLTTAFVGFISTIFERSVVKYGMRGYRFAIMEAGIISMVLNLMAAGCGLASLNWGGFFDDAVSDLLELDGVKETVTGCIYFGKKRLSGADE